MRAQVTISAVTMLLVAAVVVACTTVTPAASPATPATTPNQPGATIVPPAASAPTGDAVALQPDPSATGDRVFTIGDAPEVEVETTLEILEGWMDQPTADGQARYTFLARFTHAVPSSPDPFGVNAGYYNAIGFSVRDDADFEYDVIQGRTQTREPELLFGNLNEGQSVQGWVTFEAPAATAFLALVYTPVGMSPATFRVLVP